MVLKTEPILNHTHNVTDVWRRSILEEQQHNAEVAHERGYMDGCQSRLGKRETVCLVTCLQF